MVSWKRGLYVCVCVNVFMRVLVCLRGCGTVGVLVLSGKMPQD